MMFPSANKDNVLPLSLQVHYFIVSKTEYKTEDSTEFVHINLFKIGRERQRITVVMACREMRLGFVSTLITDIAVLFSIPTFIFFKSPIQDRYFVCLEGHHVINVHYVSNFSNFFNQGRIQQAVATTCKMRVSLSSCE